MVAGVSDDKARATTSTNSEVYSMTPGRSWEEFINYKPDKNKDQHFEAPRDHGRRTHHSIDYSAPLNSDVVAPMDMKVTLVKNYYPSNKPGEKGTYDSALRAEGVDANGKKVTFTIGHLSKESMKKLFGTDKLVDGQSVNVKAGQVIGKVSSNSKAGRNTYHVHIGPMYVNGKLTNPLDYFKTLPYKQKASTNETGVNKSDTTKTETATGVQTENVDSSKTETASSVQTENIDNSKTETTSSVQTDKLVRDKLSAELQNLISLALKELGQDKLSEKNVTQVARKLLELGVPRDTIKQALNDQHAHMNGQDLSAEKGEEEAEKIVAAAEKEQQQNVETTSQNNKSEKESLALV
jgi:hypothetical protein